jgi:uncharacterized protein (DUF362 family)
MPDPRVVIAQDPAATEAFMAQPEIVKGVVGQAVKGLARTEDLKKAWSSFVAPTNVVGIKVYSLPGALSGTRPAVVSAVVEGLIASGVPKTNIIIWDKHLSDLHLSGYSELARQLGVRVAGSADAGYDPEVFYESPLVGNLVWGDFEFDLNIERLSSGKRKDDSSSALGKKSYVSRLLSKQIQKIISITPLLNHNLSGVSGHLYGLAIGSVDNTSRFESDPGRLMEAVPEIYALPSIGDKMVLSITDALVCQYEGGERGLLHYSTMVNEIRVSKDPVALDSMSLDELERQRDRFGATSRRQPKQLYVNATLLELGQSNLKKVPIARVGQQAATLDPPMRSPLAGHEGNSNQ